MTIGGIYMARERRLFSEEARSGQAGQLAWRDKGRNARDLGGGANLLGRWCRDVSGDTVASSGNGEKVSPTVMKRATAPMVRRALCLVCSMPVWHAVRTA